MLPLNITHLPMISIFSQVFFICNVNQTHWIICEIDLKECVIYIYNCIAQRMKDMPKKRENEIMSIRRLLPKVMNSANYFECVELPKKGITSRPRKVDT